MPITTGSILSDTGCTCRIQYPPEQFCELRGKKCIIIVGVGTNGDGVCCFGAARHAAAAASPRHCEQAILQLPGTHQLADMLPAYILFHVTPGAWKLVRFVVNSQGPFVSFVCWCALTATCHAHATSPCFAMRRVRLYCCSESVRPTQLCG